MKKVESLEMRLWVVLLVAVLAVVCFLPEDSQAQWRNYSGRVRKSNKYHIEKRPPKRHGSTNVLPEVTTDNNSTNSGLVNDQMGTPNLEEQQLGQAGNQTQPEDSDYDLESDQEDSLQDASGSEQSVSDQDPEQQGSPGDDEGAEQTDQDSKSVSGSSFGGVLNVQPWSQPGMQGSGQQGQSGLSGYSGAQKWQQGGPGSAQWGGQGGYPSQPQQWGRQWSGQQLRNPWHRQAPRNNVQDALHTIELTRNTESRAR